MAQAVELTTETFSFGQPLRQAVVDVTSGNERIFYLQDIRNNGQIFYLQSDWFEGDGPKMNGWNKAEMLVKINDQMREVLETIINMATLNAEIPSEYNVSSVEDRKTFFNVLPKSKNMYIRMNQYVQFFNKDGKRIQQSNLGFGRYRVIIQPKSIYYGRHNDTPSKASLVLRIVQVQFDEQEQTPFLFMENLSMPIPLLTSTPNDSMNEATPLPMDEEQHGKKKRARRPRLQRQNAIQDSDAKRTSANLDDIFKQLDL